MKEKRIGLISLLVLLLLQFIPVTIVSADSTKSISGAGKWLPADQKTTRALKEKLSAEAKTQGDKPLLPVIQEFKDLIENNPRLFMLFTQMFEQVPNTPPYLNDPTGQPQVKNYQHMLKLMNMILTQAPEFNESGLVGFPINAILDWPMGTPAGRTAFLDPAVNKQLKKILDQWAVFLKSPDSRYVLGDGPNGWFGKNAQKAMPTFNDDFVCDPDKPYHGFSSWDDFFTRVFREGKRPVASPGDDSVIANACESAPYKLARNVKEKDTFWLKGQPYSLSHMMDGDPLAKQFAGGTVYQAFLSALNYHRWHSPVSGTVVKTKLIDGSYYAESENAGFDPAAPDLSQAYITHIASRGIIYIKADNPDIGLMCIIFVGMAEVSSNDITVYEGQHVKKGEQLGMFHFGGSTHTLIFRPGVDLDFDLRGYTPGGKAPNIPVRAKLATVRKAQ